LKYDKPILICPGVIKTGTTLLYEVVSKSPVISAAKNKEIHFFSYGLETDERLLRNRRAIVNSYFDGRTIANYLDQFELSGQIKCDVSPSYLGHPGFEARVGEYLEDPYFVVTKRDRVVRARSAWMHAVRAGLEKDTFTNAVFRDYKERNSAELPLRKYFQLSDYESLITRLTEYFGNDRVISLEMTPNMTPRDIVLPIEQLLQMKFFDDYEFSIQDLERNSARAIGSNQWFMRRIFDNPKLVESASNIFPRSQTLRRYVSRIVYRGEPPLITNDDFKKVEHLFESEFG
jgi:hypothetical protein